MTLTTTVPPTTTPLSLSDAKDACSVTGSEWDLLIDRLTRAAAAEVETILRQRLITQTVEWTLDGFASPGLVIPVWPIQSIAAVAYTDAAGVNQTLDASAYRLVRSRRPYELHPVYGTTWPVTRDEPGAVTIEIVAGYGAASDVPADIVQAMALLVAHAFEHREAVVLGSSVAELPHGVRSKLMPHVFWV